MGIKEKSVIVLTVLLVGFLSRSSSTTLAPRAEPTSMAAQDASTARTTTDHELVLAILFPETATWTSVADMPAFERSGLTNIEAELRDAYQKSKIGERFESPGCSQINRLLDKSDSFHRIRHFHRFDIDTDGKDDVIYAGPAVCSEGDITVIWFGNDSGFVIRVNSLLQMKVLKILPGKTGDAGFIEAGCCGSPFDDYYIGTLDRPRKNMDPRVPSRLRPQKIVSYTTLPKVIAGPVAFRAVGPELILRSSPEINNDYRESSSGLMDNAVFGNILSKYLRGCHGTIVGKNKEGDVDLWYFVLLDECGPFRIHSPFEVTAGWVRASEIEPKK